MSGFLPQLTETDTSREMISEFRGYNHNLRISENEFDDMKNMSSLLLSRAFPSGQTRRIYAADQAQRPDREEQSVLGGHGHAVLQRRGRVRVHAGGQPETVRFHGRVPADLAGQGVFQHSGLDAR